MVGGWDLQVLGTGVKQRFSWSLLNIFPWSNLPNFFLGEVVGYIAAAIKIGIVPTAKKHFVLVTMFSFFLQGPTSFGDPCHEIGTNFAILCGRILPGAFRHNDWPCDSAKNNLIWPLTLQVMRMDCEGAEYELLRTGENKGRFFHVKNGSRGSDFKQKDVGFIDFIV